MKITIILFLQLFTILHCCFSQTLGSMQVDIVGPIEFVVTDSSGRKQGFDPRTNSSFNEIPNTNYALGGTGTIDPADEPIDATEFSFINQISDPNFRENYSLQIIGTGLGIYLGGNAMSQTYALDISIDILGVINLNQTINYTIFFSTNPLQPPTMKKVVTIAVLRQDLVNCRTLNIILDQTIYKDLLKDVDQYKTAIASKNFQSAQKKLLDFKKRVDKVQSDSTKILDKAFKILTEDISILQDQ